MGKMSLYYVVRSYEDGYEEFIAGPFKSVTEAYESKEYDYYSDDIQVTIKQSIILLEI